jgi:hypothetical protein
MAEPDRPQSSFAGMADLSARPPVWGLILAEHLYLETEYHQGHRANFSSTDLTGRNFSGLNRGGQDGSGPASRTDFTGAQLQSANLIGAILLNRGTKVATLFVHATVAVAGRVQVSRAARLRRAVPVEAGSLRPQRCDDAGRPSAPIRQLRSDGNSRGCPPTAAAHNL